MLAEGERDDSAAMIAQDGRWHAHDCRGHARGPRVYEWLQATTLRLFTAFRYCMRGAYFDMALDGITMEG
jgi:hypothetical protein